MERKEAVKVYYQGAGTSNIKRKPVCLVSGDVTEVPVKNTATTSSRDGNVNQKPKERG